MLSRVDFGALSLDCEIAYVFGWRHSLHDGLVLSDLISPRKTIERPGVWRSPNQTPAKIYNYSEYPKYPPKFSRSLDAGRTLFPTGTTWSIGYDEYKRPYSKLLNPENYIKLHANTVELALCRIALHVKTLTNPRSQ